MTYLLLLGAIFTEVIATSLLKSTEGFTRLWPTVICLVNYVVSFALLAWSISRRRREEGGFPGAARVKRELAQGVTRRRVGLALDGKAPAREGAEIAHARGEIVGIVTSGGFSPSLGRPIAMGYVPPPFSAPGTELALIVRGRPLAARVVALPFVPHRYRRSQKT